MSFGGAAGLPLPSSRGLCLAEIALGAAGSAADKLPADPDAELLGLLREFTQLQHTVQDTVRRLLPEAEAGALLASIEARLLHLQSEKLDVPLPDVPVS